ETAANRMGFHGDEARIMPETMANGNQFLSAERVRRRIPTDVSLCKASHSTAPRFPQCQTNQHS
ncbi:MAG: hypothetical protein KDK97_05445, partial [Verrucomicrobiales bacterium]|nr:hypothetical protein [Verrucomicrobiales bacterium]